MNTYTLTPRYPRNGDLTPRHVAGFRAAIGAARELAGEQVCGVSVRNDASGHSWLVSFRVRCDRRGAGYCTTEVSHRDHNLITTKES